MKKKKTTYVDDGRTIANMNVEGMPWYHPEKDEKVPKTSSYEPDAKETLAIMGGILKAAMLVAGIFVLAFTGFILFSYFVWLK